MFWDLWPYTFTFTALTYTDGLKKTKTSPI